MNDKPLTPAQYRKLIAAVRKAAADADDARWMARLLAAGDARPRTRPKIIRSNSNDLLEDVYAKRS